MVVKNVLIVGVFLCFGLLAGTFGARAFASLRPLPEVKIESGDFSGYTSGSKESLVLISTSTCPYCKQTREYLDNLRIKYKDYVVDESSDAQELYRRFGSPGVPFLFTTNHKMLGYSPKSIDRLIAMDGIGSGSH